MPAPTYISAPSCQVVFMKDDSSAGGAFVDSLEGRVARPVTYYDGGSGNRYAFAGLIDGDVQFTDLLFDYSSDAASSLSLTTNDILPTSDQVIGIDVEYGGESLISFSRCMALFDYTNTVTKGQALFAQGNHPFKIFDPGDSSTW